MAVCIVFTLFSAMPFSVSAAVTSGTTGECTWTLDGTHLTISGNGKMGDYRWADFAPWVRDITSVTIENGVTSIGDCAFSGCAKLTSITIPESVTDIGNAAFLDCTGLVAITVDENNKNLSSADGVVYNKDKTTLIIYPEGKTTAIIPDGVTTIADDAFAGCINLTSVTIPDSVTSIDYDAFDGCDNLVMTVFEGSFAHKYAVENNIKFKLIETVTGDPNGDGVIGLDDAILAARTDVGNTQISDGQIMSADVNGDGKVTVHDALLIVRFSLGLIDKFPTV